jgi:hypothetical protein
MEEHQREPGKKLVQMSVPVYHKRNAIAGGWRLLSTLIIGEGILALLTRRQIDCSFTLPIWTETRTVLYF